MPDYLHTEIEVEVPFHDVDAMGVAWHGNYVKYCEAARCRLLQMIDYDYPKMRESGFLWPVVELWLKYVRPARYGQRLRVRAALTEYENRIRVEFRIHDAVTGERMTEGYSLQVAVDAVSGELQFVSPPALLERVEKRR
ncbi:MAG TPA: thioesterase family protein [Candidatus Elarobacter sp.]|jgi:acyl-CoA thioester hydrolase